jgi:hypothetical protein
MANSNQLRIYAGAPLKRFFSMRPLKPCCISMARMGAHGTTNDATTISESVALNRLVERYLWLMDVHLPLFNNEQTWCAILDAYNGWTEHSLSEIETLSPINALLDHLGLESENDLAAAEKTTGIEFAKIAALTPVERMAVIEAVERFWGRAWNDPALTMQKIIKGQV